MKATITVSFWSRRATRKVVHRMIIKLPLLNAGCSARNEASRVHLHLCSLCLRPEASKALRGSPESRRKITRLSGSSFLPARSLRRSKAADAANAECEGNGHHGGFKCRAIKRHETRGVRDCSRTPDLEDLDRAHRISTAPARSERHFAGECSSEAFQSGKSNTEIQLGVDAVQPRCPPMNKRRQRRDQRLPHHPHLRYCRASV